MNKTETIHILLVDDEKDIFFLFSQFFKKWIDDGRVKFTFSESGVGALDKLSSSEAKDILLILSDINMPEMDGFELLNKVNDNYPEIETIMISAYSDDFRKKAMNLGATAYFEKPIDFQRLKDYLKEKFKF